MKFDDISRFATKETSSRKCYRCKPVGCHMIVATKDVANLIIEDLRKHNFEPSVIGFIARKGVQV